MSSLIGLYPFADAPWDFLEAVFEKSPALAAADTGDWRYDRTGRLRIHLQQHGNLRSLAGWLVSPIVPFAEGGDISMANLEPAHWQIHVRKGRRFEWRADDLAAGLWLLREFSAARAKPRKGPLLVVVPPPSEPVSA